MSAKTINRLLAVCFIFFFFTFSSKPVHACSVTIIPSATILSRGDTLTVSLIGVKDGSWYAVLVFSGTGTGPPLIRTPQHTAIGGTVAPFNIFTTGLSIGAYRLGANSSDVVGVAGCSATFRVAAAGSGVAAPCPTGAGGATCDTGIGNIPTNPVELAQFVLQWVLGIAGGIAFLLMLLGATQVLTSQGNPERLQAGKDHITSAAIGLLFIILSIVLLRILGVDILKIPGFA